MAKVLPIFSPAGAKNCRPWFLFGVDPLLAVPLWAAAVDHNAVNPNAPVVFTEGLRTAERQASLRASGASQVAQSKHQIGMAVDVAILSGGEVVSEFEDYRVFWQRVRQYDHAKRIRWGGDWPFLRDACHFEL